MKDPEGWARSVAEIVRNYLEKRNGELLAQLEEAERRIVELQVRTIDLERRGATVYRGVWAPSSYDVGDMVTFDGGLWICREATTARPATSEAWQLAVRKQGRAA